MTQSVQSQHPFQFVIKTIHGYREVHGGVPIDIGMKAETKESEGAEFIIKILIKHIAIPVILMLSLQTCLGQSWNKEWYDSLLRQKSLHREDTSMVNAWNGLGNYQKFGRADSSIYYSSKALELSRSLKFIPGQLQALENLALTNETLGNINRAIQINREGIELSQGYNDPYYQALFLTLLADDYTEIKNYRAALKLHR